MQIRIEYPAPMRLPGTPSGSAVELAAGAAVADLLAKLGIEPRHRAHIAAFVGGARVPPNHPLADGDLVLLQVPISGG